MTDYREIPTHRPIECPHQYFGRDWFSHIPDVKRPVPGDHVCMQCGSYAERLNRYEYRVWMSFKDINDIKRAVREIISRLKTAGE